MKDGWLRRDGVDLHHVEWDAGAAVTPAILFLHGLGSNARFWDRTARLLSNRTLVALDQRGHGLTGSRSGRGFAIDDMIDDVAFAVTELGLQRPLVVGHSWGASVALEFVTRHPELASALVYVDGPAMGIARLVSWEEAQAMMQPPLPHYATLAEAAADSRHDFAEAWGDDLLPFVEARVIRDGDGWIQSMSPEARLEILRDLYHSDPEKIWPNITVPAVVLAARKNDPRICRWADLGLTRLHEIAPSVVIKRFDTPHDIPLYSPAGVAEEIERLASQDDLRLGDLRDQLPTRIAD